MKAKNLFRIALFAVIACMILSVCALANTLDAKIITFDADNTTDIDVTCTDKYMPGVKHTISKGIYRIDIPAEYAYGSGDVASQPTFAIPAADQFEIEDYPYIKLRMRTNYNSSVQCYYATTSNLIRVSRNTNVPSGKWHDIEMYHGVGSGEVSYTASNGQKYDAKVGAASASVTQVMFQIKDSTRTPSRDFFFEIDYIGYFKNKADMEAYDNDKIEISDDSYDAYYFAGDYIAQKYNGIYVSASDGSMRIYPTETDTKVKGVFLENGIFVNNKNAKFTLYDYPYVAVKHNINTSNDVQFYTRDKATASTKSTGNSFYTKIGANSWGNGHPSLAKGTWRVAKLAFANAQDLTMGNDIYKAALTPNTTGAEETTKWITRALSTGTQFPTEATPYQLEGFLIQNKTANEGYADIKYIAISNNTNDMYAGDNEATDEDMDKIVAAAEFIDSTDFKFTMHSAFSASGETAITDYIRDTIEANNDVYVFVKNIISADDGVYTYNINYIAGDVFAYDIVSVEVTTLPTISLTNLGAQIRADGDASALRFGFEANVDTSKYDNITVGALILPKAYRGTNDAAKLRAMEKISIKYPTTQTGVSKAPAITTTNTYKEDNGVLSFNAVVTGIPDGTGEAIDEYGNEIVARPFISYTIGDRTFTIYGEEISRSVNGVKAAFEADSDLEWNA